ncbi:hypothetical protein [Mycobacteroides abscessus]|uniref:hypothetical protein n=1 Tax=Mycobacteroides abscessus TaxID=36809 RepID=UPI000C25B03B|nr:hypothetical protein [Mycobacteroides abscessus]PVA74273.1 hypothetical protein DDJ37_17255 [Mycobacteroides abscessus]RIS77770.1 hypothetical protein D2E44_25140 [Mycobacteroides abscessus]
MPAPQPKDPLDDPIAEFVQAIDDFLSVNLNFDTPPPIDRTGPNKTTWADIQRAWEDLKRALRKAHASLVGVQPEVMERLEVVATTGATVLELTEDPCIVGPVNDLLALMEEMRTVITRLESTLGKAASVLGVLALLFEAAGLKSRLDPLSSRIATARDNLIAYNLMRPHPPESA